MAITDFPAIRHAGAHQSSSPLGQWVHDNLPRVFNWVDDDFGRAGVRLYARSTNILRLVEHKFLDQRGAKVLTPAEWETYGKLAELVADGVGAGRLNPESGVFILWCDVPPTDGLIAQIRGGGTVSITVKLRESDLLAFLTARPLRASA